MAVSTAKALRTRLSFNKDGGFRYVSEYRVTSTTATEDPTNVVNAAGLPQYREPYRWPPSNPTYSNNWAFAVGADAVLEVPQDSRTTWLVTIVHETLSRDRPQDRPTKNPIANPLSEPVRYSGSFQLLDKLITRDKSGELMQTKAEQPYPPYRIEDHRDNLIAEVNTATIDLDQRRDYIGKLNSVTWCGFSQKVVKLFQWTFNIQYYGLTNTPFVVHRLEFHFDPDDLWKAKRPNVGSQKIADGTKTDPAERYSPILDSEDNIISVPLDSAGAPDVGQSPITTNDYDLLKLRDFADLPIPSTLPNPPFA